MDSVHFNMGRKFKTAEITVEPTLEDCSVSYLVIAAFSGTEAHLAFQVNVTGSKEAHVQIGIQGPDRHIQFGMIDQDMIRRLSLLDQRGNDLIFLVQFPYGHVDAGSGIPEILTVFTVSKTGIVNILMCDGAVVDLFATAVADIRGLIQAVAVLLFKVLTGLITGGTGSAFDTTEDDLAAGICFLAMIPMNTEVLGVIKSTFVIPVGETVSLDFF